MQPTRKYVTNRVAGESVKAFIPTALPLKLSQKELAELRPQLWEAEVALSTLQVAGQMIPSLDWFVYAFICKEALLSSEIEGTQETLTDIFSYENIDQPKVRHY